MLKFWKKDYGRILVQKEEDIDKVKSIIKQMNEYEYKFYMPQDIIGVFKKDNVETVYTHKFTDIDLVELQLRCWEQNIPIMVIIGLIDTDYGKYKEYEYLK